MARFGRNVDLYYLGLDRNEWGTIHLILGFIMLGLLVLHVVLHWKSIHMLFHCLVNRKLWQVSSILIFSLISLLLLVFPFVIHIEVKEGTAGTHVHNHASLNLDSITTEDDWVQDNLANEDYHKHSAHLYQEIQIQGQMTVAQVADTYDVPVSLILNGLQISDFVSSKTQLGHLRKQHGFHISDVVHVIQLYRNNHSR